MEIYGNATTCNIERVLYQNILLSDYYKSLHEYEEFDEIVDEIYNIVEHCEPWLGGNARGASSAFCLLMRLTELKLEEGQIRKLVNHNDSPYIRALGFLYLRYCCNPRNLLGWFLPFLKDSEEIAPAQNGKTITVGVFCRDILLDMNYFETLFPRIPVNVMKEIVGTLEQRGLPTKPLGNAGTGGGSRRGGEGSRPASVKAALSVSMGQRAPNRGGGREATEERQGGKDENGGGGGGRDRRDHREDYDRRDNGGGRGRDDYDRDRPSGGGRGRDDYDRGRDRPSGGGRGRDDYDRDRYNGGGRGRDADYGRDRDRDRGGRDRPRSRSRSRDRHYSSGGKGGYDDRGRGGYGRGGYDDRRGGSGVDLDRRYERR